MISDAASRDAALNPAGSYIVQAPAGSGKTGLLVYRMLRLLAQVEQPQQVLAITFTRKATAEMRERLLALLERARENPESEDAFEQLGLNLARDLLAQDRRLGWRLLDTPHQLQIHTIDAFCARLSGSMPWLSRLGDRPRTTDDASRHYDVAVERVLKQLLGEPSAQQEALNTVLLELDYDYNKARKLFKAMLMRRDQWLRHIISNNLTELRVELEQAWLALIQQELGKAHISLGEEQIQRMVEVAQLTIEEYGADDQFKLLAPLAELADTRLELTHWQALRWFYLTDAGTLRKQVGPKFGFKNNSGAAKQAYKSLSSDMQGDTQIEDTLLKLASLPAPKFTDQDWGKLCALESVLKGLAAELQLRFRATGECDHSEVTQRANLALSEMDTSTDLGVRLDAEIRHILVDEFQDTSYAQIELLKRLTQEWQPRSNSDPKDESRTLFLVGDPMQSIYRFREAEVGLFLQVADNAHTRLFPNLDITFLNLTQNFRSSKALVDWYNEVFSKSFPEQDNVLSGAISYVPAVSNKESLATVCRYRLASNKDNEAALLCDEAERVLSTLPEGAQAAILVRSRTHLAYLLPALQQRGIAYVGVDIQKLNQVPAVIDAVALIKALCREQDRISWLSLLRGPWCGLGLDEIHALCSSGEGSIWQRLQARKPDLLGNDSERRLSRLLSILSTALAEFQQVSLSHLAKWTWLQLGGEHTLNGALLEDVEQVFELVAKLEQGGDLLAISELDQAIEQLYSSNNASDARLLVSTMHKAKGLQYHTVILAGLAQPPVNADKDVLMWAEGQTDSGETQLFMAPYTFQGSAGNVSKRTKATHYQYLRDLDVERARFESTRLFYVAATRAEQELVLLANLAPDKSGNPRQPRTGSLLHSVWPTLASNFVYSDEEFKQQEASTDLPQTLHRLPADCQIKRPENIRWNAPSYLGKSPSPQLDLEFAWATEVATGVGLVLHDYLQRQGPNILMANPDAALQARWRKELFALRVPEPQLNVAVQRVLQAVRNIQADRANHFLFSDYELANNEYALSNFENGRISTHRVDRTFVSEQGVRWVVDYKSTDTRQADKAAFAREQVALRHQTQLQRYGQLFADLNQQAGLTQPIQLAVYFPLLQQLVSWPLNETL